MRPKAAGKRFYLLTGYKTPRVLSVVGGTTDPRKFAYTEYIVSASIYTKRSQEGFSQRSHPTPRRPNEPWLSIT